MNIHVSIGLLAVLFAYLFFPLSLGANVFAFDAFLLLFLFGMRPELARQAAIRWGVFLLLASATSVVIVHSGAALVAHHVSLLTLMGFAQRRELRFVWYAVLLGVISLIDGPRRLYRELHAQYAARLRVREQFAWLLPAFFSLVISLPFLILYLIGNQAFFQSVESILDRLGSLENIGDVLLILGLLLIGLAMAAPFFLTSDEFELSETAEEPDRLLRRRQPVSRPVPMLALRQKFRQAVMVFSLLNVLVFAVNLTDLRFLWLYIGDLSAATLSEYVHAGTNSLIASIVLAMLLVLYYFRGNLNFYNGVSNLRLLVYGWLAQNAFLALSVGVRNWYYVQAYGLAYGRIYVVFALCLVLTGVYSLYRKVGERRSLRYLLQVNGMAAWLFLVAFGGVNWTGIITRINLQQADSRIDWNYLVHDLDDTNHFLLRANRARLPSKYHRAVRSRPPASTDWRSWNYANWRKLQ